MQTVGILKVYIGIRVQQMNEEKFFPVCCKTIKDFSYSTIVLIVISHPPMPNGNWSEEGKYFKYSLQVIVLILNSINCLESLG